MSERVDVSTLVPEPDWDDYGEDEALKKMMLSSWSTDLMRTGSEHGVYRQCSLGWHGECSQREHWGPDCECNCTCHVEPREFDMDVFDERNWSPEGVVEVCDYVGDVWALVPGSKWACTIGPRPVFGWLDLLRRFGPVVEIVRIPDEQDCQF